MQIVTQRVEESGEEVEAPMPTSSMEASAYSGRSQVPTKLPA